MRAAKPRFAKQTQNEVRARGTSVRRWAAGALLLAWPTLAAAHETPANGGERKLVLELDRAPVRVVYALCVAGAAAERARSAADRDANGEVSANEANQALDLRASELLDKLRICSGDALDGELTCAKLERRDVERVDSDGWSRSGSLHVHLAWTLRLPVSADRVGALRIEDEFAFPDVAISTVEIEPPGAHTLIAAGAGPLPRGVARHFNWIETAREPGPRVLAVAWDAPRRSRLWILAVALVLALASAGAWLRFRGRFA